VLVLRPPPPVSAADVGYLGAIPIALAALYVHASVRQRAASPARPPARA
jgi:hypothetical protein